ncbi:MAG: DUF4340 domain-containing protein [Deltaproteobacteria bacterium]|nr:DUF4340 domain-containing protein [Deltaproteobacteria bacterium]
MKRSLLIYTVLLLGTLGWAYQTWTHEDELALQDKVVIVPGTVEQLAAVSYRSEDLELSVEMRSDEHGRYGWGTLLSKKVAPAPPTPPPAEGEPAPEPPTPEAPKPRQFKVGKAGEPVFEGLAPFIAKRKLEGVGDDLAALGLDPPQGTLEITREGKEMRSFELGSNAFGDVNVYLRDPNDGAIYLVESRIIRPLLKGSTSLADTQLTGVVEADVERVTLAVGDRQVSFEQHNPDDNKARFWALPGEAEKSPEGHAWVAKALRLRSSKYVPDAEVPVDLAQAFDFQVAGDDGTVVTVEVLRNFDDQGQEQFFARSEHTRGLVLLPRSAATDASADVEAVLQAGGA